MACLDVSGGYAVSRLVQAGVLLTLVVKPSSAHAWGRVLYMGEILATSEVYKKGVGGCM